MSPRSIRGTVALIVVALFTPALATSAVAQSLGERPAQGGPTLEAASVAFRPAATSFTPAPVRYAARLDQSEQFMIIGGAIFLAGAIIGDDAGTVIMVGGAALGIYGLYLYLDRRN